MSGLLRSICLKDLRVFEFGCPRMNPEEVRLKFEHRGSEPRFLNSVKDIKALKSWYCERLREEKRSCEGLKQEFRLLMVDSHTTPVNTAFFGTTSPH